MFLTFTVEIFGDLNRDLKCYFECIQICGKLVLAYMSSGKKLKMSACVDLQLQIFLL